MFVSNRTNGKSRVGIIVVLFVGAVILLSVQESSQQHTQPLPSPIPITHTPETLTLSWVGDMVPTSDSFYNATVFEHVAPYLQAPDIALGNLEGTFARSDRTPKCFEGVKGCFVFRGTQSFASVVKEAGFDLVSVVNNHSLDYGKEGLEDTEYMLSDTGIDFISQLHPTKEIEVKGFRVGFLGIASSPPDRLINNIDFIATTVRTLKERNDIVVVIFHGGAEGPDKTLVPGVNEFQGDEDRGNVELVAHSAIDAGATLVLGSGPHVLRKVEYYKDGLIAYSLGNFVGGNGRLNTNGTLGTSGILYVTLARDSAPIYSFVSTTLSKNGVPAIDESNAGFSLLQELSR